MSTRATAGTSARRALVTGGAAGIGWAICRALAAEGIRCAIADIDLARAWDRAAELGPGHVALGVDLADVAAAADLPRRAAEALGGLEIVVNNAGITDPSGRPLGAIPEAEFDRLVAVNLGSVEAIGRAALDRLPAGGVVVNLASGAALRPIALRGAYSATKAGVLALTETLDRAAAPRGQRVAAVAPGFVRTELVEGLIVAGRLDPAAIAARVPLGRLGRPEEIAAAVLCLTSEIGAPLAGQCLVVDGGSAAAAGAALPQDPAERPAPGDRIAVVGTGPEADALATGIGAAAVRIDGPDEIAGIADLGAVIDARGLGARAAGRALAEAHRLVRALEALPVARGGGLLLLTGAGTDPVAAAALGMLARTLALEWATQGSRVNALDCAGRDLYGVAGLARWLAGPAAAYVTGQLVRTAAPRLEGGATEETQFTPAAGSPGPGGHSRRP